MSKTKDSELERLRRDRDYAFEQKQAAFNHYRDYKEQASVAHRAMEEAWHERSRTREIMNHEFEERRTAFERRDEIWAEYHRLRDELNARINALRAEADREHEAMRSCFDQASTAYEYGDRSEAPYFASEGREHQTTRDELNAEVQALAQDIKDARTRVEAEAPRVDSSDFDHAKAEFERAKLHHETCEAEFKRLKAERDNYKEVFDGWQAEFLRIKGLFEARLAELKAENAKHHEQKLVRESNWGPLEHGWIDGHPVTFKQGLGIKAGQTLIADGHLDEKAFRGKAQRGHNHYGPDTEHWSGRHIEEIGGDRGKYTGPGH